MKQIEGGNCYISFPSCMGQGLLEAAAMPLHLLHCGCQGCGGWDGCRASPGQAALTPRDRASTAVL